MKLHVMVRFGMWQEILAETLPENTELFSFTTALPESRFMFNNPAADVLLIAD